MSNAFFAWKGETMNYYDEIKNKLIDNEVYERVKDYSKERHRVVTYYEIGRLLSEAGKRYGDNIIGEYSEKLMIDVGKKYNKSTLFRMKQFYNVFSDEKIAPLVRQLTWSHCLVLLPLKDSDKINYYITQISRRNLSKRQLIEIIKSEEYERVPLITKNKIKENMTVEIFDLVKNPILIKSSQNYNDISEKILQNLILDDIPTFMKELGNGYSFVDSEYKIKLGDTYNYIDLLLFNIEYNCYVVIELKVTELKKEHIGQIEVYMNYIDNNIRKYSHDKTIGIIVCKKDNKYIIEYSSDPRIISRKYELV